MADFLKIGKLIENLAGFVKVKIELLKLEILEEISRGIANLFTLTLMLILGLFVLAFGSLTVGIVLNNYFDSNYLGYLIITGFFVLLFVGVLCLNWTGGLTQKIEDQLVKKSQEVMDKKEEENE